MGNNRIAPSTTVRSIQRSLLGLAAAAVLVGGTTGTQDAVANGDTRTLSFFHVHSKETASVTFRRNGSYDSQALSQLNWILRDWRSNATTKMDPRLFDIIWEVHRSAGSSEAVHINSAFRSPETNGMLRRRSRAVSKHSQHMNGRAMDFYLPDVDMTRVRAIAMRLQQGGVGYYPSSYNSFVHLDSGSVRSWPRMTRDQLVRLFPNEKTVHLPTDNKPLSGYEEAKAEILSRGGSVVGYAALEGEGSTGAGKSLWARLFGGGDDEDTEFYQASARNARGRPTARSQPPVVASAAAYAPSANSDDGGMRGALAFVVPNSAPSQSVPTARRSRGDPQIAGLPEPATSQAEAGIGLNAADEAAPARLALAPMPPRRPGDLVAMATLGSAPLPPNRPIEIASIGAVSVPGATGPRPDAVVARTADAEDRAQLRDLFAAVASDTSIGAPARVATARTQLRSEAPSGLVGGSGAGLKLGFSPRPVADLGANRFTGPAVKPLPILR